MRYRDLKQERDDAVARAVEAERLSMKSEFDRVTAEFKEEKARLVALTIERAEEAYNRGFDNGVEAALKKVQKTLDDVRYCGIPRVCQNDNRFNTTEVDT